VASPPSAILAEANLVADHEPAIPGHGCGITKLEAGVGASGVLLQANAQRP
jgi:hypothetical protein